MFKLWVELNILTAESLVQIDQKAQQLTIASDTGRVPSGFASNWTSFTANEWKVWTLVYSMFVLEGILPEKHLKIWCDFVIACHLICRSCVTVTQIKLASSKFRAFGERVAKVYGTNVVTPNMHKHMHLEQCQLDYGSIYVFWLMAFERYNGVLSDIPTNHHNIEVKIMQFFLQAESLHSVRNSLPQEAMFTKLTALDRITDVNLVPEDSGILPLSITCSIGLDHMYWQQLAMITVPQCFRSRLLAVDEHICVTNMYRKLYPHCNIRSHDVAQSYRCYSDLRVGIEHYSSVLYARSKKLSGVVAAWCDDDGDIKVDMPLPNDFRPGRVKFFMKHSLMIDKKTVPHMLACVKWFMPSDSVAYKKPASVWKRYHFVPTGPASFIPVQRLAGKIAWAVFKEDNDNLLVVCPLHAKVFM